VGEVENVSRKESYDLLCWPNGQQVHVEVKGTTTDGESVLLSPNEVQHARKCPHVALFVVSNIGVTRDEEGALDVTGGKVFLLDPWEIDAGELRATGYVHSVPEAPNQYQPAWTLYFAGAVLQGAHPPGLPHSRKDTPLALVLASRKGSVHFDDGDPYG